MKRRDFLKTAAVIGAAGIGSGIVSGCSSESKPERFNFNRLGGGREWKLAEAFFLGKRGPAATEDISDPRWTRYTPGTHEVILENKGPELVVRMLNSRKDDIVPPSKLFLFTSEDGEKWTLDCIKDTPAWVNTNHDAFVDLMVFDIDAKHIKLAFTAEYEAYMEVR